MGPWMSKDRGRVNVIVRGFQSDEHARAWIDWYEGQGEQDQDIWMDC